MVDYHNSILEALDEKERKAFLELSFMVKVLVESKRFMECVNEVLEFNDQLNVDLDVEFIEIDISVRHRFRTDEINLWEAESSNKAYVAGGSDFSKVFVDDVYVM